MEKEGDRSDRLEVSAELATKHRAAVTRVVYLAQDRLDSEVAAVERVALVIQIACNGPSSGGNENSCFDHGCRWGHMSRNTSFKFRRHRDAGKSSHRCVEPGSTAHRFEFG